MTWYGHELVLLISISKAPAWSPSSPAWHHDLHHLDLHQRVAMRLSRRLLLPRLLLTFSDKVKHYIALNDWHAGHTIIKDNSMAPASCRTHRHASRDILYNTWSSHTSHISHHVIGHITSQHTLQKQVRTILTYAKTTTVIQKLLFNLLKDRLCRIQSNLSGRDRHPPAIFMQQSHMSVDVTGLS